MKKLLPGLLSYCLGIPFFAHAQPIRTAFLPGQLSVRITNDSLRKNYTNVTLHCLLFVNGLLQSEGVLPGLNLLPGHPRVVLLPLHPPAPGQETYVRVEYRAAAPKATTSRALSKVRLTMPVLAAQTLPLDPWAGDIRIPATGELSLADSNDVFTVSSPTLRLSFDKESGWIRQYTVNDQTLLADTGALRPALPAATHLQLFSTSTGSRMVIVRTEYTVPELACLLHLSYTVNADGALLVEQTLETDTTRQDSTLHPIDRFGMNWTISFHPDSLSWYGLCPATTPTDSHSKQSSHPATDSLPSICNALLVATPVAKNVRWCDLHDQTGKGFRLTADSNLLQLQVAPPANTGNQPGATINIDNDFHAQARVPIHLHYAFKLTPLTTIMPHPSAKPF